jgi:GAF domain-containing protein
MGQLIEQIMAQENDFAIAHQVAIELTQYVAESEEHQLVIEQVAESLKDTTLIIWKMQLLKTTATNSLQKKS